MLQTAEFWVLVSFVIFMAILGYVGVHKTILSALDTRSKKISDDLDEARALREEAQKVLAEYERKRREAEGEAVVTAFDERRTARLAELGDIGTGSVGLSIGGQQFRVYQPTAPEQYNSLESDRLTLFFQPAQKDATESADATTAVATSRAMRSP